MLDQPTLQAHGNDPKPDYIIVFDTSVVPTLNEGEQSPSKAEVAERMQHEYTNLLGLLQDAGLEATGRNGGKGKILVFVRASETRVQAEIHRER